jgi:hypothetical protein
MKFTSRFLENWSRAGTIKTTGYNEIELAKHNVIINGINWSRS